MSREISKIEENMRDNAIFSSWTENWGIKVRPAFEIDKLCFEFIQKGQQGSGNSFKIFMDCEADDHLCFDDIASDMKSGRLENILTFEKKQGEQYPKYYAYVTGSKGEKKLGLCNSSTGKGYCINAIVPKKYTLGFKGDESEANKSVIANIPISYHGLRKLCERFLVSYEARKEELEMLRLEAVEAQAKARVENGNSTDEKAPQEAKEAKATEADKTDRKVYCINFKTSGEFFSAGEATKILGHIYVTEKELSPSASELFFYEKERVAADTANKGWYERLCEACKKSPVRLRIKIRDCGTRNGKKQYQFLSVAA